MIKKTGQALGLVLAKNGLSGSFSPISGNFIRMFTAMIVIWLITIIQKKSRTTIQVIINNPRAKWKIIGGAFLGPVLGVSLSLFALQHTSVGVASTLMALAPVFILPIDYFYFKERFGWGSIAGKRIMVDPGHIAMFDPSVEYDIAGVKGLKNVLFSGEGLFLATLTGPGNIWLQSLPLSNLAKKLARYLPAKN